ncbi:nif-specific transcriptional activator NifA [Martelella alba]|uniref:Nif-specific regulatory protein n=1 Tax=Martelella alba TaxID=2590451 RepID=A0A506U2B6_9HYPH|nr:nif-specific transcriptional activator NifA [Martelella alba]TPW28512.1 nif-specific transcriptional activator NifA [Martelella alba]
MAFANTTQRTARTADISLSGIYEISKILAEPARLELTLANVVNILSSFLQMRGGAIVVIDEGGLPELTAIAGTSLPKDAGDNPPVPQAVIDEIVATATPLVIPDVAESGLFHKQRDGKPIAFIGVPVKAAYKVLGTLSIDRERDGSNIFRYDDDVRFLTMVANLVGQTIRLHRLLSEDRQRMLEQQRRLEKSLEDGSRRRLRKASLDGKASGIVGSSPAVRRVLEMVEIVAGTNSTVLLRGESGTGKELFAQTIHAHSKRKDAPFIKLNCAALPESVLESELFGHEKGAFTGATSQRMGRFEIANGGTLLLDEIGEISPAFQAKLLRVLQEGEFERVGGNKTIKVDVRLICATNKDLEDAVRKGDFRADLYYRINVVPIILPPLRERAGDIPPLAENFLSRFNQENRRHLSFDGRALDLMSKCFFPGNVRELENCVQRTATLARDAVIQPRDLACSSGHCLSALLWTGPGHPMSGSEQISALAEGHTMPMGAPPSSAAHPAPAAPLPTDPYSDASKACDPDDPSCPAKGARLTERERLIEAMEKSGWVQAKAARLLGLTPRQVGYALRRHDIPVKRF